MGTNYYWHEKAACETCGHLNDPRHIGKSSSGWVFALHVYPEDGINDLPDWVDRFSRPGIEIRDEYGCKISPGEMLGVIMLRWRDEPPKDFDWVANGATHGPHNLIRAKGDQYRSVKWGSGTWDCHTGDFS